MTSVRQGIAKNWSRTEAVCTDFIAPSFDKASVNQGAIFDAQAPDQSRFRQCEPAMIRDDNSTEAKALHLWWFRTKFTPQNP